MTVCILMHICIVTTFFSHLGFTSANFSSFFLTDASRRLCICFFICRGVMLAQSAAIYSFTTITVKLLNCSSSSSSTINMTVFRVSRDERIVHITPTSAVITLYERKKTLSQFLCSRSDNRRRSSGRVVRRYSLLLLYDDRRRSPSAC